MKMIDESCSGIAVREKLRIFLSIIDKSCHPDYDPELSALRSAGKVSALVAQFVCATRLR
jgi:hypothetical protein